MCPVRGKVHPAAEKKKKKSNKQLLLKGERLGRNKGKKQVYQSRGGSGGPKTTETPTAT